MEAFTDSLAKQMSPLGVQVNVVEPGNYKSEIGRNATARTGVETRFTNRAKYKEPDEVAHAVLTLLLLSFAHHVHLISSSVAQV
jgi:NAD(P)-dependent dehydrogenase (short-subunit alcohol dehydrogenase family)